MESLNNQINEILALHFSGEKLTDEQEKIFIDWVCQNKEEYHRLSEVFQSSMKSDRKNFNVEQAWNKVEANLSQPKTFKLHQFRQYLSYAACIAVLLGISIFYLAQRGEEQNLYSNTTNSLQTIMLPDSSSVTLYPQSKVTYLADSKNNERKTELEGKAFFKVKPNAKRPFIVNSKETAIRVLGTSFLVDGINSQETGIFVRDGIVQVSTGEEKVILKADEQALSNGSKITMSKIENSESLFEKHIKSKAYKNAPLSVIISDIEEEFNIKIQLDGSIKGNRISTKLKFVNIEDILSEISYICNIKYKKISDKKYELSSPNN